MENMFLFVVVCGALLVVTAAMPVFTPADQWHPQRIPNVVYRVFNHPNLTDHVEHIAQSGHIAHGMATVLVVPVDAERACTLCGVVHEYHTLVPGAYKADLVRYCLLWLYGGWYADIALDIIGDLTQFSNQSLVVVQDLHREGYWNGLIGSEPRHPALQQAMEMIKENVAACFYGTRDLDPTGPTLWKIACATAHPSIILSAHAHDGGIMHINGHLAHNKFVGYKTHFLMMGYNTYNASYGDLWNQRRIYDPPCMPTGLSKRQATLDSIHRLRAHFATTEHDAIRTK